MKRVEEAKNTELTYRTLFPTGKYFKEIEDAKRKYLR